MTNGWIDIRNADVILAMGGNPAENHPVGFRWFMEAKKTRGVKPASMAHRSIEGRDARRELRLEYVQIRELARFLVQQLSDGIRSSHLAGFVDNLDRRLHAHERGMTDVYYPAAELHLTAEEWIVLEKAKPDE